MYCPHCHAGLAPGTTQCPYCGTAIASAPSYPPYTAQQPIPTGYSAPVTPPTAMYSAPYVPAPTVTPWAPVPPIPVLRNETEIAREEAEAEKAPLPFKSCLYVLLLGLLPIAGIILCLVWGFGQDTPPQKRILARCILWIHGIVLAIALICLSVWVIGLATALT